VAFHKLTLLSTILGTSFAWAQSFTSEEQGTLKWHLNRAKAEGRTEVNLGLWIGMPPEISSTDEALSMYSTVIVQPLVSKTYVAQNTTLITWYKVRILDAFGRASFSRRSPTSLYALPADVMPTDLLPLAADELLILQPSGMTVIDGITVSSHIKDFPSLSVFSRYICFLDIDPDGQWATVPLLGVGVFEIVGDSIRALSTSDHPVAREVKARFDNSLGSFREHAKQLVLPR
jgi:hypothetical protein